GDKGSGIRVCDIATVHGTTTDAPSNGRRGDWRKPGWPPGFWDGRHGPGTTPIVVAAYQKASAPIWLPAVVIVDVGVDLPRHRSLGVDIRALLDLLHGQSNREFAPRRRIQVAQNGGRQKDSAAGEPISGIDDQPTNQ